MSHEKIMDDYEHQQVLLEELRPRVKTLIEILSKENSIEVHDVQARVKEKSSLKKKIEKKQGKYHGLKDITDIVGIRVITYFNDDVDKMARVIEKEFQVDRENSIDKRVTDPDRFGYSSLHYVVELNAERLKLIEYKDFNGIKFEIQIRSILQHAWAEIEHDLGYKSKNEVPEEIRRDFSRIAGLLEIADNEFIRIKGFLKEYTHVIERKIENEALEIPIDKITLKEYIEKSPIINQINERVCKEAGVTIKNSDFKELGYIDALNLFGIKTISHLDKLVNDYEEKIISFYLKFTEDDRSDYIVPQTSVFFLFYVLLYENNSSVKLSDYSEIMFSEGAQQEVQLKFQKLKDEHFSP